MTSGRAEERAFPPERTAGWDGVFPVFVETPSSVIRGHLEEFVKDASESQVRAWKESIPALQHEAGEVLETRAQARGYTAILECRLPLEARRADAIFLVSDAVVVIELKGKSAPSQADLDQAAAYARDLRAYHSDCQSRAVHAVLVPMRAKDSPHMCDGVWVTGPQCLDDLVCRLTASNTAPPPTGETFLAIGAYRPLPTLVQAARELFESRDVREVWKARAATDPAVDAIATIAHDAAKTKTRHLILITGVPGSGKTLVGMRAVHAHYLDDLAVPRASGKPTTAGLYLSGNGPLVEVLQYVLKGAGGGGRTFVRHIKDYLDSYIPKPQNVPPQHLLVFDEAQRAFTPDRVQELHNKWASGLVKGEPELFVSLCERIPEWSVLVGLIGSGQEIHLGEEGGLAQWRHALERCKEPGRWTVHAPALVEEVFVGGNVTTKWDMALNLDTELRFHAASELHQFVDDLLSTSPVIDREPVVAEPMRSRSDYDLSGVCLWITRDLEHAKQYMHDRYSEQPDARYGLLASSRDKLLEAYGINNSYQATKNVRLGPWYTEGASSNLSCRCLEACVTEFGAQGLELDMALVGWGSDLRRTSGRWDNSRARGYRNGAVELKDPYRLRVNAYRVLLTRGRDGTVIFVPPTREMDETCAYLVGRGFRKLEG
jgi:DUF2075 family protein